MANKGKSFLGLSIDHWQIVGAVAGAIGACAALVTIWQGMTPAPPPPATAQQTTSPSSTAASAAPSATGSDQPVRSSSSPAATRTGTARLTFAQDGFDLDTISVGAVDNTPDLSLENGVFYVALEPLNDSRMARVEDDEPRTLDACTKAWHVVTDVRLAGAGRTEKFGVNSQLCLTTASGNVASLRVDKVHDSTDADDWWVELDVIVWQLK
ncbi:hypothetical protein AB0K12_28700 [Nonomuraea sp. NPDC049419]|uniref:hypothetical protein n=1 Tax=Nonomuraea sp. NPDC049419 TaxID=3155772 RepID=UPI00343477C9